MPFPFWCTSVRARGADAYDTLQWTDVQNVAIVYGALLLAGIVLNLILANRISSARHELPVKLNRLRWRPWTWNDMARIIIVLILLHIVVLGVLQTIHYSGILDVGDEQQLWIVAHSVALHWAAIAIIVVLARRRNITWQVGFACRSWSCRGDVLKGLTAYIAAVPLLVLYAALYHYWLHWIGHEPAPQDVVKLFADLKGGFLYFYLIALAVLVAPISEELLFRGVLLPALSRRIGVGAAILISSALFASIHFHVPSLVPLFVFAMALSLAYIYTESIIVPIIMHALFNSVSLWVMMQIG